MEATKAKDVVDQLTAQDYTLFLYVVAISIAGGIVATMFNRQKTFKEAAGTFFGSIVFGSLIGGISLVVYSKVAYILAAACSLFGRKIYGLAEKKIPEKLVDKAGKMLN